MTLADLPKQYDPKDAQDRWYEFWVENGYFHADPAERQAAVLHRDPAAERHRGTAPGPRAQQHAPGHPDPLAADAGVRRPLDARHRPRRHRHPGGRREAAARGGEEDPPRPRPRGAGRADLGLEGRVREAHPQPAPAHGLLVRLGPHPVHARRGLLAGRPRTFFNLFKAGKIFRGKRLVNWDTQLRTAVADDEIYYEEVQGHLWTIKYPVAGSDGEVLHVATTRPETMLGDTAVAVHPDDPRYKHLIGKTVDLPLTGRRIPIIADPMLVDPAFGTGCVKVTPAHDPNDYQAGLRNDLPMINLLNPDGTYNENAGPRTPAWTGSSSASGSSRTSKAQGLLERVDSYLVRLNHSDRSKTPIEPYLSDQWFVRMGDDPDGTPGFAQQAMDAVTSGRVKIHPERYAKSYLDWLGEKRDWCISRQLWWGHRIPIWYVRRPAPRPTCERAFARPRRRRLAHGPSRAAGSICAETDLAADALGPGHVADPGPRRPRHLVQLGPLAALDPGLARADARAGEVLPDERPLDGPRHHHPLGGPDGDLRPVQHGRRPVPRRLHPPGDPGRQGQADVEVGGQRHRPGRHHRALRRRRLALHPGRRRHRDPGPADARREAQAARRPRRSTPRSGSSRAATSPTSSGTSRGSP